MFKIDHRKTLKPLYHPSSKVPAILEVPPMNFLMVDGRGKPDGKQFPQAASILYPLAYTHKWMVPLGSEIDIHVIPMEVLWKGNREKKDFAWTIYESRDSAEILGKYQRVNEEKHYTKARLGLKEVAHRKQFYKKQVRDIEWKTG